MQRTSTRRNPLALLALWLAAVLTGCGASHAAGTHQRRTSAARRQFAVSPALPDRLLWSSRLPGLHDLATSAVISSASAWDNVAELPGSLSPNEARWLKTHGFLGGVQERLAGPFGTTAEVYATVEQFRSVAGARAELAHRYLQVRHQWPMSGARFSPIEVSGIPHSDGYDWSVGTAGPGVLFAAGHFVYWVGSTAPPGAHQAPSRGQLISAAQAWSRRTQNEHSTTLAGRMER